MTLQRQATQLKVLLDGEEVPDMAVMSVTHSLGGQRVDTAVMIQEMPNARRDWVRAQTLSLREMIDNRTVEIIATGEEGERVLHYGRICAVNPELSESGERLTFTSRFDSHLLGSRPVRKEMYLGEDGEGAGTTEPVKLTTGEIVFNPISDPDRNGRAAGVLLPSMWRPLESADPIMIDPAAYSRDEAVWGENLAIWHWSLPLAVHYLLQCWNSEEKHVKNPTVDEIVKLMVPPEGDLGLTLRDVRIPMIGTDLPSALDSLLTPFGWSWYIEYLEPGERRIWFRSRTDTTLLHTLPLQPWGESLDPDRSAVCDYSLQFDIANRSCTRVMVRPEPPVIEMTMVLVPGWEAKYDKMSFTELNKTGDEIELDPGRKRAWRCWVANETGEYYSELRKRACSRAMAQHETIKAAFAKCDAKIAQPTLRKMRRRFLPLLTRDTDSKPKQCEVEFTRNVSAKPVIWEPLCKLAPTGYDIDFLPDELGIVINKNCEIPLGILAQGGDSNWANLFAIRVTACIQGDEPTEIAEGTNPDELEQDAHLHDELLVQIDGSDRYSCAFTHPESRFYIHTLDGTLKTTARYDESAARSRAKVIYDAWSAASCTGTVVLWGLDVVSDDILGRPVTIGGGRDLSLNTHPTSFSKEAFPIVIEVSRDVDQQTTMLVLDSYRHQQ